MSSDPVRPDTAEVGPTLADKAAVWRGTRNDVILATGRENLSFSAACGLIAAGLIVAILLHAGYPTWRVLTPVATWVIVIVAQMSTLTWVEGDRARMNHAVLVMHALAQIHLVSTVAITGGIYSPMLPSLGTASAVPVVFFGARAASRWLTATLLLLFISVAVLPVAWLGPRLPHTHYVLTAIVSFSWTIAIVTNFVTRVLSASQAASSAVDVLNEERVAAAAEHAGRLQAVGAKVAHELKNPLASVKGLVQLLARSPDAPRTKERLDVMQAEIARMETILAEYLSFSRPLEDLRPHHIDLSEVTGSALAAVAGRVESGRIAVHVDTRPTSIDADPRRLKEALLNVLSNAVEATPAGGAIHVRVRPEGDGGVVVVKDSGRGIRPDDLARLGTSYFTTREGGTGLGVVLAATAVAQHGGTIHYASEVGHGTTVTIRLPLQPAAMTGQRRCCEVLTTTGADPGTITTSSIDSSRAALS